MYCMRTARCNLTTLALGATASSSWLSMYRQLFEFALCVCFIVWLPGVIDCQAPAGGDAGVRAPGVDVPGEPVLIEKEEMEKEMEVAEKKENQRKLEEGDEFEVINHEKDEELREKGDANEKDEDLKVQVAPAAYDKEKDKPEKTHHQEGKEEDLDKASQGKKKTSLGFFHAFAASVSVIIVSELGDKTFFIAAILAMKHSRWLVFGGAISALGLMTFLSVCLGFATMIIPRAVTFYITTALLALFGLKMLYEGWNMSPDEGQEEFDEVSEELRKKEEGLTTGSIDAEQGLRSTPPLRRRLRCFGPLLSPIFLQAFSLTFLAEWGDRSQITTIILGARENPFGVIIGGTLGHALCTALAVIGGKIIAQKISVRTVTLIGGVVFLIFALTAFLHNADDSEPFT